MLFLFYYELTSVLSSSWVHRDEPLIGRNYRRVSTENLQRYHRMGIVRA
jgi:hypothetical protein